MIKAVIFDMFETLITLFDSPLYQGKQIAQDMHIPEPKFREIWDPSESDRTLGKTTVEEVIEQILRTNGVYTDELYNSIVEKRRKVTGTAFDHLHPEIIPMLEGLKAAGIKIALISNCFFEERDWIKKSALWNYFDCPCLSCDLGLQKPDVKIFEYCMNELGVCADECLYVGDGGSWELETAEAVGMKTLQACWYLKEGTNQPVGRKMEFAQADSPLEVLREVMNEINAIELTGSHIHPALGKMEYDGWTLQFSGKGATRRANSVLLLENGNIPLSEKVLECEKIYAAHNLPCVFKMTKAAPAGLQELLVQKGYAYNAETDLMSVSAADEKFLARCEEIIELEEIGIIVTLSPDETWLDCYFKWENRTDPNAVKFAKRQFEIVDADENLTAVYCRIQISGVDVAVASAVIDDGNVFLLNVVVDETLRGKGYGKILVKETLEAASTFGAEKLYLQVVADNTVAVKLYESFGFEFLYKYWYMVK